MKFYLPSRLGLAVLAVRVVLEFYILLEEGREII
jgi:hypothetical protein